MKLQMSLPIVLSVLFAGCIFTHEVDIEIYSTKYVKRSDIGSVVGGDVDLPLIKDWTADDFLVVEINTITNLIDLTVESGSSIFPDIYFCEETEEEVILGVQEIYFAGESVSSLRLENRELWRESLSKENSYNKYYVVLFLVWDKERELPKISVKNKRQANYVKFNLREEAQDVCISFQGSNLVQRIQSNRVRLTKVDIEKTMDKGRQF